MSRLHLSRQQLAEVLEGVCFGLDVPDKTDTEALEYAAFWTGTLHYQPWRDVAAFFGYRFPHPAAGHCHAEREFNGDYRWRKN